MELKRLKEHGFLCIFDDDTSIDESYFCILNQEMARMHSSLYVPLVYAGGRLLSPCKITKWYNTLSFVSEKQLFAYRGGNLSAINSGMAVALSLFEDYFYDENIFLDGVDHKFLKDMKLRGHTIHIMPYRCNHEFSGDSMPAIDGAEERFGVFVKDYGHILQNSRLAYLYLIGKRMVHLTLQYRSLTFLRTLAGRQK